MCDAHALCLCVVCVSLVQVDAISSADILTQFLKKDNIAYAIRYVTSMSEVAHCVEACKSLDIKSIFLINCGAVSACGCFVYLFIHLLSSARGCCSCLTELCALLL
jgi:hypothetical protein